MAPEVGVEPTRTEVHGILSRVQQEEPSGTTR
jgi:hypothetical protein